MMVVKATGFWGWTWYFYPEGLRSDSESPSPVIPECTVGRVAIGVAIMA